MLHYKVVRDWKEKRISNIEELDKELDIFKVAFGYNSAKLDNLSVDNKTVMDIFKYNKILNFTGSVYTIQEQINQRDVYNFILPHIIRKTSINIKLIKKFHYQLLKGTYNEDLKSLGELPGEFKTKNFYNEYSTGTVPENLEIEINELIDEIENYKGEEVYKAGAYFYVVFNSIKPFASGNEKVARTIINYYYLINGYPPLVIYNDDKSELESCIKTYQLGENLDRLCEFMKNQLIKTWL